MNDPYGLMSSGLPPEIAAEAQGLAKREAILKALTQQSLTPIQAPETKGRFQGQIHPMQGIAQLVQAYLANRGTEENKQAYQDLAGKMKSGRESAMADYIRRRSGAPGTPETQVPGPYEAPEAPVQVTQPATPAVLPNPRAALEFAATNPYLANNPMISQDMKSMQPHTLGRSMVIPATGEVVGVDPLYPQEKAADRAAKDAEARKAAEEKKDLARLVASLRPEKTPPAPSITEILDPADKTRMLRVDTRVYQPGTTLGAKGVLGVAGKEPAAAKKEEQVNIGRETVSGITSELRKYYQQLSSGGGITDPSKGILPNVGAAVSSSGVGQAFGNIVGTENQSARNSIAQTRPLLLNAIKQATGMSAKQMDSNAELNLYLRAATDPKLDIKANLSALDKLDELYGLGQVPDTPPPGAVRRVK